MSFGDRLNKGVVFSGTYTIYSATSREVNWQIADVEIRDDAQICLAELRVNRQRLKDGGLAPRVLGDNHLAHELVVVFGPDMSAKKTVKALELIVKDIKRNGLFIGRRKRTWYAAMEEFAPRPIMEDVDQDDGPAPYRLKGTPPADS